MKQPTANIITTFAPGKLIISGEHAVVYGCPALAISTNEGIECQLSQQDEAKILVNFPLEAQSVARELNQLAQNNPQDNHLEIVFFLLDKLSTDFKLKLKSGLIFNYDINMPVGCGMGASAAFIIASLRAICQAFELELKEDDFFTLAKLAEDQFHGKSSGLDIMVSMQDTPIYFQQGKFEVRTPSQLSFAIVNTGKPSASTAACVNHAAQFLANNQALQKQFSTVTNQIDQALQANNPQDFIAGIKQNHQLLCKIGVVPKAIQKYIAEIEQNGGAAKICGAGSLSGEHAGILLEVTNEH